MDCFGNDDVVFLKFSCFVNLLFSSPSGGVPAYNGHYGNTAGPQTGPTVRLSTRIIFRDDHRNGCRSRGLRRYDHLHGRGHGGHSGRRD